MPNTINIVQPKAEDGVTEVSFVTRTNSIFKSDGSPLGDSLDEYMEEVDELSSNLSKKLYEKTYTNTSQTWQTILNDFYSNIKDIISAMDVKDINRLKIVTGDAPCQVYNLMYVGSSAYHFIAAIVNSNNISLYGLMLAQTNSLYVNSSLGSTISFGSYTGQAISSARTLQLYLA